MNVLDGVSLIEALYITIFSMLLVFLILAVISVILSFFKYINSKNNGTDSPKEPAQVSSIGKTTSSSDTVNPNELELAAIMAAIEAYSGFSDSSFVVRNIRKIQNESSSWAIAGRQANVQKINK